MKSRIPSKLRTFVTHTGGKRDSSPCSKDKVINDGSASEPASPVVPVVPVTQGSVIASTFGNAQAQGTIQTTQLQVTQVTESTQTTLLPDDTSPIEEELAFSDEEEDEEDVDDEEEQLQVLEDLTINTYSPDNNIHQPHHMTYGDADSVIGGHSITSRTSKKVVSDVEDSNDDSDLVNDIPSEVPSEVLSEIPSDLETSQRILYKETSAKASTRTSKSTPPPLRKIRPRSFSNNKYINNLKQQKVFSFSLPFNNPLANIDLPSLASLDLPTVNFRSMIFNNTGDSGSSKDSLSELAELDSDEEDVKFGSIKRQDNTRVRAVRNTLTRNFSLPMSPAKQDTFPIVNGDVVIMGGYRGSILRDRKTNRRIWIPIKVGLNMRRIDLAVGINDEDEYNMEKDNLYPDGMLTHIGPIDISKKLIKKLDDQANCKVYEFGYDWRLSSDINSAKLREFLRKIKSKSKQGKAPIVIAHSMGGLIAHHALQQEPELFRGLLYAGVPSSCPNILGPFRYGDSVLLSSRILTAKVNFLMRSSFVFLPLDGKCFVDRNDSTKRYDLDFFDVNTWIEYGLSPCVSKSAEIRASSCGMDQEITTTTTTTTAAATATTFNFSNSNFANNTIKAAKTVALQFPPITLAEEPIPFNEAKEYLERTLKRTKKFLLEVKEVKPDVQYPPLAVIYGCTLPTLRGAKVDGIDGIKEGDYDHLQFGAGDGVVYRKTLMPHYYGFPIVAKVASASSHVTLLTDIDGVGRALSAILEEESVRNVSNSSKPNIHHSTSLPIPTIDSM